MNPESDKSSDIVENDTNAVGAVQLLLAEQRTALAVMRTGIAVLALPLSVFSLLVATSKYYDALAVLRFLLPLAVFCACMVIFGIFLVARSMRKVHRLDKVILRIKLEHTSIARFIESTE